MPSPTSAPIRRRLTLAAIASLALIVTGLSWFVYIRTSDDLLDTVDAGLRSRSEILESELRVRGPDLPNVRPTLIETDEGFAQVADTSGRVLDSSPIVAGSVLVPTDELARIDAPVLVDEHVAGIDNVTRVLVEPVDVQGARYLLMVGASLQDRRDEMLQLAATLAVAGLALIVLLGLGSWRLIGAMMDRVESATKHERELIDRASHELRTPLAIQRVGLDLALSGPQTPRELRAGLEDAAAENTHLARVADDLLVLARGREGALAVRRRDVCLRSLLVDAADRLRPRAEARSVRITADAPEDTVSLDPDWLRQALDDLVDNAIRATPPGGVVRLCGEVRDGRTEITVQDTGTAFDPAFLAHAFEPFRSGDREDGAGLGLTIVRAIAEAHGGTATAANADGGARVVLSIP